MNGNIEEIIIQNLIDAGCVRDFIMKFMDDYRNKDISGELSLLAEHRRSLLNDLHTKQKRLDCLDYLVYKMKKENSI